VTYGLGDAGFERIEAPLGWVWARPEAVAWCRAALTRGQTLFEAADGGPLATGGGRGQVRRVGGGPEGRDWVVRHGRRGGWMARLLVDRYLPLGPVRPEAETHAALVLSQANIPTPRVVAAATYPSGLVRRHDLVSQRIPGRPLVDTLRAGPEQDAGRRALDATSILIDRMAAAGARHIDLNAHNLLFDDGGKPPLWVLDLDGMRLDQSPEQARAAMWSRLLRSLAKLAVPQWAVGHARALAGGAA